MKVAAPRFGVLGRQLDSRQSFNQIAPRTDLLVVGHKPGDRHAVLQKHKSHILVVSAVDAINEVPRCLGDGDGRLFDKNQIIKYLGVVNRAGQAVLSIMNIMDRLRPAAQTNTGKVQV